MTIKRIRQHQFLMLVFFTLIQIKLYAAPEYTFTKGSDYNIDVDLTSVPNINFYAKEDLSAQLILSGNQSVKLLNEIMSWDEGIAHISIFVSESNLAGLYSLNIYNADTLVESKIDYIQVETDQMIQVISSNIPSTLFRNSINNILITCTGTTFAHDSLLDITATPHNSDINNSILPYCSNSIAVSDLKLSFDITVPRYSTPEMYQIKIVGNKTGTITLDSVKVSDYALEPKVKVNLLDTITAGELIEWGITGNNVLFTKVSDSKMLFIPLDDLDNVLNNQSQLEKYIAFSSFYFTGLNDYYGKAIVEAPKTLSDSEYAVLYSSTVTGVVITGQTLVVRQGESIPSIKTAPSFANRNQTVSISIKTKNYSLINKTEIDSIVLSNNGERIRANFSISDPFTSILNINISDDAPFGFYDLTIYRAEEDPYTFEKTFIVSEPLTSEYDQYILVDDSEMYTDVSIENELFTKLGFEDIANIEARIWESSALPNWITFNKGNNTLTFDPLRLKSTKDYNIVYVLEASDKSQYAFDFTSVIDLYSGSLTTTSEQKFNKKSIALEWLTHAGTSVSINSASPQPVLLQIIGIGGNVHASQKIPANTPVALPQLLSGGYYIQASQGEETITELFIIN